jgi:hypothetical protein
MPVLFILLFLSCKNSNNDTPDLIALPGVSREVLKCKNTFTYRYHQIPIYIVSSEGKILKKIKCKYYLDIDSLQFYSCNIKGYQNLDTIWGDFNGDGKSEYAYHEYIEGQTTILFSDKKIPPFKFPIDTWCCISLNNEGDLNNDGKDEIGLLQESAASGCEYYNVFTYKNNKLIPVLSLETTPNMRVAGIKLIEKDIHKKGYVFIRFALSFYNDEKNLIPDSLCSGWNAGCSWSNVIELNVKFNDLLN